MILHVLWLALFVSYPALSQNLMEERIWKVSPRKKSIFLDAGVFHHDSSVKGAAITGVRSGGVDGRGYERLVVDFSTKEIPKIYGHISPKEKKISVDFFATSVATSQPNLKKSKNVSGIDFISVDGQTVTMELKLSDKASFDVFYLESPGRLVFDIR